MTINLITYQNTIHHGQVEWDVLSKIITQFAYFDFNKIELVGKTFFRKTDDLQKELNKLKLYLENFPHDYQVLIKQLFNRLPADESLDKYIKYLSKEGVLNFIELNKVTLLIESAIFIKNEIPNLPITEISIICNIDFVEIQKKYLKEFRHLVNSNGEVDFEKHPELSDLNRKLRELEDRLRRSIQDWINQPANSKVLQFSSYDVHYDRFVVPVRSDSYRSDLGLIVSRSESGQTLFVEPFEVREMCNRRIEVMAKIDEIINNLGLKFSRQLGEFTELIQIILVEFRHLDFYFSKVAFTEEYSCNYPTIRQSPGFKFTQLFHPLIKNPVGNDVVCEENVHGIVISGPNTGGKTVFLKSITLSYLLFFHGFFVPAKEAELFPYEGLFYFGNDLQDLKQGLSSFSGEVRNYIDLMNNILSHNLILIDEIFNSTSSDEASALSLAYFDELHNRSQCHIVVSTHHQMFKTLIHQNRNYLSCHVGFDTNLFKPTYKIIWGTPGASMAIDIFKIISRDANEVKDVPGRAIELLSEKNFSYETLLQKVTQKQIELDKLFESNLKIERDLKNQKSALEGVLNLKMNEEINKAKKEIDRILNEARILVEEVRKNKDIKIRRIDDKSHQLKTDINKLHGNAEKEELPIERGSLSFNDLKKGDLVQSLILNKEFSVVSLDSRKNEVTIAKGPIKLTVSIDTLRKANKSKSSSNVRVSIEKSSDAFLEHDVRGMRLSEFQGLMEKALGDLLAGDIPYLSIIHGHGDGILKNWLRAYLKRSNDFTTATTESGNDGETKIILK
jgi:DNA mismatch repair protein MutS2